MTQTRENRWRKQPGKKLRVLYRRRPGVPQRMFEHILECTIQCTVCCGVYNTVYSVLVEVECTSLWRWSSASLVSRFSFSTSCCCTILPQQRIIRWEQFKDRVWGSLPWFIQRLFPDDHQAGSCYIEVMTEDRPADIFRIHFYYRSNQMGEI
jgi:hypothetical protein